jgi:hypothetical protein
VSAMPIRTSHSVASPLNSNSVLAGQRGWDEARRAWQRVAAQRTGHNAAPLGSLHDTLLLKAERMRGVTIDARARKRNPTSAR